MAKVVIETHLEASNQARAEFIDGVGGKCFTVTNMYWPLDEFEELVEFVRTHIEEQAATGESKLSELAPEDLVPGGDK